MLKKGTYRFAMITQIAQISQIAFWGLFPGVCSVKSGPRAGRNPLLFRPVSLFFHIFPKKVGERFGQYQKRPYLCTRFREAPGVSAPVALLCSLPAEPDSIFDRLRTEQEKTSSAHIYIIYIMCMRQARSHSFIQTNEQWSRKAWPVRQNYNETITVKSLILAQDER